MNIPTLNFPEYNFSIKQQNGKLVIFDTFRKKWIVLTPEEWVRQNLLSYLSNDLKYPKGLIAIEKEIVVANRKLRFDALIYGKDYSPKMIIECKAPEIKITQEVFDQILTYNYITKAPYLLVTNGLFHVVCRVKGNSEFDFLEKIPDCNDLY